MGKKPKYYSKPQDKEEVQAEPKEETVIVDAIVDGVQSMLNIRSTPETNKDNVITTLGNGSGVKVENPKEEHNGFYKIIIFDKEKQKTTKGYAMKKFIKIV